MKIIPSHVIVKLLNTSNKKFLKCSPKRKKRHLLEDFSSEMIQENSRATFLKVLTQKYMFTENSIPVKVKTFLDKLNK